MKRGRVIISLEIMVILFVAISLWYKVFIPYSYFFAAIFLAILLTVSMFKERQHKYLIVQIFLVYLLINSVYGLATRFSVLPYGDVYWEYGVVTTFFQEENIFVIHEEVYPASKLTWYSGWPEPHTFALILSQVSRIDLFHVILLLPLVLSICSFAVVYLFFEKLRSTFSLSPTVTTIGLLIYTASPDSIFWRTQFVRQNFGILWVILIFYIVCLLISQLANQKRKVVVILTFCVLSLVITHHLTSFLIMIYFFFLFIFLTLGKYIAKTRIGSKFFWSMPDVSIPSMTLSMALIMLVSIFVWWDNFGTVVWPTVAFGVMRFIQVMTGTRKPEFFMPQAYYPNQLAQTWILLLLRLRDILLYLPSLFGLFFVWTRKLRAPQKFFVVYSMLSFGLLFLVNGLTFKIEVYRLVVFALPFIALLTAIIYNEVKSKSKRAWNMLAPLILILIVSSSFVGLWGHNFAPMHLYDPSINPSEVGENNDPSSLSSFFHEKIQAENFKLIWTDDIGSLLLLLEPCHFKKIRGSLPKYVQKMGSLGDELICELNDFNLYSYYAGTYSPIENPEDAKVFGQVLKQYVLSKFNLMYDNGKYRLWENSVSD